MYSFVSGFMYLVESFCVSPIVCVHPARSWYSPQFTKKRKKTKGGGKPVTIKKGTSAVAKPDSVREWNVALSLGDEITTVEAVLPPRMLDPR